MSTNPTYRDRDRGGEREREGERGGGGGYRPYNNRGGSFRGRGGPGGYKPRRYWDSDDYYKDERDHGRGRRRRSYSRSRSRSRSYSSRSRSRSRSPSRRGRSRSPQRPKDISQRPPDPSRHMPEVHEPYIPTITKEPSNAWSNSRMQLPQEYMTQTNGQSHNVPHNQLNPYGNIETTAYPPPPHYQGVSQGMAVHNPSMGYGYGHIPEAQYQPQQQPVMYPHGGISQTSSAVPPPPPALSEVKVTKDDASSEGSKKKKDKRKKKKRHHSSSSSSSSSDDSSESRRRRKSKKENGSSDSSSDEDKKESSQSAGLTTAQKDALLKQREGYQTKLEILEREIAKLQNKEDELIRSRAESNLIDENLKLQAELKGRCKAVLIVLEKIDDVLKVKPSAAPEKPRSAPPIPKEVQVPQPYQQAKVSLSNSPSMSTSDGSRRTSSYDYFDNGQHWCRLCNVFPDTVEHMLAHFHSKEHHDQIQQLGIDEKPWHKRNSGGESKPLPGASKAPFRGMQFFSPVEGWYCRLCNSWMGDPHCAVEHLKSDEHNANYMNFLEEHPDWEHKWVSDRERALGVSGKQDAGYSGKKSRFDDTRGPVREANDRKPVVLQEDLESGKSIRVQMRNSMKSEERSGGFASSAPAVSDGSAKDTGLDEWMTKPKVTVDIIDTQKFAAIVRQKHGAKEKEAKEAKPETSDTKSSSAAPPVSSAKEKDYKKEKDDRRRTDKVELQISNRDKDRDRYRDRDSRSSRRRSRSRSRSRSRDRRYNRRRSRSRSRSRSRDRSDRDRDRRDRGSERDRPDFKEAVKKLPMIGKMPLYKRPIINRDKPEPEKIKPASTEASPKPVAVPPAGFLPSDVTKSQVENISMYNENPVNVAYGYDAHYDHSASIQQEAYGLQSTAYGQIPSDPPMEENISKDFPAAVAESTEDIPAGEAKEGKEDAPAALPDDFQQALDIIYAAPGSKSQPSMVPQPVPPPSIPGANGITDEHSAMTGSTEYGDYSANGYASYMGYQPYQQSFDGYAPVGYDELDDGPPGVGDGNASLARPSTAATDSSQSAQAVEKDPPPPGDDDMDDLRMLGIDVDDAAVVVNH